MTYILFLHPHSIQENAQKFMRILLREIEVLVIFPTYSSQQIPTDAVNIVNTND